MSDHEGSTDPEAGSVDRPPTIIRAACILLLIVGFGSVLFSLPAVVDPATARCHLARTWLDDANTDKKAWNNVDTGGRKASALPCADAVQVATRIPLKEKGTSTASVPGETALRIQQAVGALMGLGQAMSGWLVLRRLSRPARTAAIAFSAVGILLRTLGILSFGVFVLVVYAFTFSPASREIWPREPRSA